MKRFVVFYNPYFDSKGGFLDYAAEFDVYNDAFKYAKSLIGPKDKEGWWNITDIQERIIYLNTGEVWRFPNEGKYGRRTLEEHLKKMI